MLKHEFPNMINNEPLLIVTFNQLEQLNDLIWQRFIKPKNYIAIIHELLFEIKLQLIEKHLLQNQLKAEMVI
jgi:hypothetical protein